MHENLPPHCESCGRFTSCLVVDMVMRRGYCNVKVKGKPLSKQQVRDIQNKIQSGNYEVLFDLEKDGVLFMPSFEIAKDCPHFWGATWRPNPPPIKSVVS
ncbi:MAG: hypothetical protein JW967_09440 [Dehalococcoidales bacterium]|nr:hypothetical protein [Dehalococcoidales bacterium]